GRDGGACGAHRRQHREAAARYVVWGLTLVAGGWLLGLGAGCWGLTLGAGGSRRFDEESDSTAWRSVNRRRRRTSAGDRRGQECRQGGAARARAAEGGRERGRSGWNDGASLGGVSGRSRERGSSDSRRREGERGHGSWRHAALDREPERKRRDGSSAVEGGR